MKKKILKPLLASATAAFLLADPCNPGASIAHLVYLWTPYRAVCLALQAEGLVLVRHVNQWSDTGVSI